MRSSVPTGGYNPSEEAEEAEEQAAETDEADETEEAEEETAEASTDDEAEENAARTYALTVPAYFKTECRGKDRGDMNEYKLKIEMVFCFSNMLSRVEYYHNSSFLEHGGSPDKATRAAFVKAFDIYLKNNNKYSKNESKVTYGDIEDCLVFIVNSHSTRTSYENQTKKAITNTFIAEAMTDFFLHSLGGIFRGKSQASRKGRRPSVNQQAKP